ncbi:hypothetical protein H7J87_25525 [Mycolicibacterium wolinskyi]|nr:MULTISPECIES: hypothetical protein [Mycolicibacterium]MCV7288693.1 hypothetical protein [Mycolicibacterium wolinskyi]MCV7295915.1 hypothetical protein [Mycolicibacterium goodii]
MHLAVRPYATAGIAMLAAGAIIASPIAPPPPDIKVAAVTPAAFSSPTTNQLFAATLQNAPTAALAAVPGAAATNAQQAFRELALALWTATGGTLDAFKSGLVVSTAAGVTLVNGGIDTFKQAFDLVGGTILDVIAPEQVAGSGLFTGAQQAFRDVALALWTATGGTLDAFKSGLILAATTAVTLVNAGVDTFKQAFSLVGGTILDIIAPPQEASAATALLPSPSDAQQAFRAISLATWTAVAGSLDAFKSGLVLATATGLTLVNGTIDTFKQAVDLVGGTILNIIAPPAATTAGGVVSGAQQAFRAVALALWTATGGTLDAFKSGLSLATATAVSLVNGGIDVFKQSVDVVGGTILDIIAPPAPDPADASVASTGLISGAQQAFRAVALALWTATGGTLDAFKSGLTLAAATAVTLVNATIDVFKQVVDTVGGTILDIVAPPVEQEPDETGTGTESGSVTPVAAVETTPETDSATASLPTTTDLQQAFRSIALAVWTATGGTLDAFKSGLTLAAATAVTLVNASIDVFKQVVETVGGTILDIVAPPQEETETDSTTASLAAAAKAGKSDSGPASLPDADASLVKVSVTDKTAEETVAAPEETVETAPAAETKPVKAVVKPAEELKKTIDGVADAVKNVFSPKDRDADDSESTKPAKPSKPSSDTDTKDSGSKDSGSGSTGSDTKSDSKASSGASESKSSKSSSKGSDSKSDSKSSKSDSGDK